MSSTVRANFRMLLRAIFVLGCLFVLVRSVRVGVADSLARSGQPAALARAIALEGRNDAWPSQRAILLFQSGDTSTGVEMEMLGALSRRPDDAALLAELGLFYEQRGDNATAESMFLRAVSADHRFTPSWSIANFYYRTANYQKMWPYLQKCLALIEPDHLDNKSFDPAPVYALAWSASSDAKFILSLIPRRRETLVPYLAFLTAYVASHPEFDRDAADTAWSQVIRVAEPADEAVLVGFLDQAVLWPSPSLAVRVWNDLIARGFIHEDFLDPKAGKSIANRGFEHPAFEHGFGWHIPYTPGIIPTLTPHLLSLDFTGAEPEHFTVLSSYVPVLPSRNYRLRWKLEKRDIPGDVPGMVAEVKAVNGAGLQDCSSLDCKIAVPPGVSELQVALKYQRPKGALRLRDTVVLKGVTLELEDGELED